VLVCLYQHAHFSLIHAFRPACLTSGIAYLEFTPEFTSYLHKISLEMPPPKRSAQEANIFEDANPISKQKLAAQAQLAGRGRRGNGNGNPPNAAYQVNNVHSSLKDLARASEAVSHQNGASTGSVRLRSSSLTPCCWMEAY
jgi:hypothetical protein